jgi:CubicO group peptidase (beta-lactamase class C family)
MHFNGIFVVVDHGQVIYQNQTGYANVETKTLIDEHTKFSLASLSKVFTTVAALQLVDQGKIKLDDPLKKYIPDFPYPAITIWQLLTHTSGLPDMPIFQAYAKEGMALTVNDLIPAINLSGSLLSPSGTAWNYSSIGIGLLALLVEKVSGMSFPAYVKQHICVPAHMTDSFVDDPNRSGNNGPAKDIAIGYIPPQSGTFTAQDEDAFHPNNPFQTIVGPGLMVSTATDMIRFDQALYAGVLLSPQMTKEMFTPARYADGKPVSLVHAPIYQGLGWGIDMDSTSGEVVSHNGGAPSIATIFLRNLDTHTAVILLENTRNRAVFSLGVNAMNLLNGKPFLGAAPGQRPGPGR